jgi:hypothetical protein
MDLASVVESFCTELLLVVQEMQRPSPVTLVAECAAKRLNITRPSCDALITAVWLILVAEVADKEGPLLIPWLLSGVLAVVLHALVRWRAWMVAIAFPIAFLWAFEFVSNATDAYSLPALIEELGVGYIVQRDVPGLIPIAMLGASILRASAPEARAWWFSRRASVAEQQNASCRVGMAINDRPPFPWRFVVACKMLVVSLILLVAYGVVRVTAALHGAS